MRWRFYIVFSLTIVLVFFMGNLVSGQTPLPINEATGKVSIHGKELLTVKSKKKIMKSIVAWFSVKQENPNMVYSTIQTKEDTLILHGLTEVPSVKNLHPITFRLTVYWKKKRFDYVATDFKFEDINLTLEEWLAKYGDSENERTIRNLELIKGGIASHINLGMINLRNSINQ